jgi:hypothetical protein
MAPPSRRRGIPRTQPSLPRAFKKCALGNSRTRARRAIFQQRAIKRTSSAASSRFTPPATLPSLRAPQPPRARTNAAGTILRLAHRSPAPMWSAPSGRPPPTSSTSKGSTSTAAPLTAAAGPHPPGGAPSAARRLRGAASLLVLARPRGPAAPTAEGDVSTTGAPDPLFPGATTATTPTPCRGATAIATSRLTGP